MQIKTGPFLRSPLTIKQITIDVLDRPDARDHS